MKKTFLTLLLIIPLLTFASIDKDLRFGMRSSEVTKLQNFLLENKYITKDSVTGYFGPKTLIAVKKYQKDNLLPQVGQVGPMTRGKINNSQVKNVGLTPVVNVATTTPVVVEKIVERIAEVPVWTVPQPSITTATAPTPLPVVPTKEEYSVTFRDQYCNFQRASGTWEVNIPFIFSENMRKDYLLTVDGTVPTPEENSPDRKAGIGTEFYVNSQTPSLQNIPASWVRGLWTYNITLKNRRGDLLYELKNQSMMINKCAGEINSTSTNQ